MRRALVTLLLTIFPAICCGQDLTQLRIGALLHLTGEFAAQGIAFREGIELGIEEFARKTGSTPQLLLEDTRFLTAQALTGAKKLTAGPPLAGVIISTATEAKAAAPLLSKLGIPTLIMWDGSPQIEALGTNVFSIGVWAPDSGKRAAEFARKQGDTAAIIHHNTEWSVQVADSFRTEFEKLGGKILGQIAENPENPDFKSSLLRVRQLHPDSLYAPVDSNLIAFFQQRRQLGLTLPTVTSDIITADNLVESSSSFEGIYQTQPITTSTAELSALEHLYHSHFQRECTQLLFVAWGYDAVRVILEQQGNLKSTVRFHGALGPISFDGTRSSKLPLGLVQIRAGKFVRIND